MIDIAQQQRLLKNKNIVNGIENLSCGGFIMRKTIQGKPLRRATIQAQTAQDFKNKNISLYITKKFDEIRQNLNTCKIPSNFFHSACLRVKQNKENEVIQGIEKEKLFSGKLEFAEMLEEATKKDQLDKLSLQILQELRDMEKIDDFFVETEAGEKEKKNKQVIIAPEQRLRLILNKLISSHLLEKWFHSFKRFKRRERFNKLKLNKDFQKVYPIKGKIKARLYNAEMKKEETEEEIIKLIIQVCQKHKLKVQKLLKLPEEDIQLLEKIWGNNAFLTQDSPKQGVEELSPHTSSPKSKLLSKQQTMFEFHKRTNVKQNCITEKQLNKLIEKENKQQTQKLVEIFQKTRSNKLALQQSMKKQNIKFATTAKQLKVSDQMYEEMQQEFQQNILSMIKKKLAINQGKNLRIHKFEQDNKFMTKSSTAKAVTNRLYGNPFQNLETLKQKNITQSIIQENAQNIKNNQRPYSSFQLSNNKQEIPKTSKFKDNIFLEFRNYGDEQWNISTKSTMPQSLKSFNKNNKQEFKFPKKIMKENQSNDNKQSLEQLQHDFKDFVTICEQTKQKNKYEAETLNSRINKLSQQMNKFFYYLKNPEQTKSNQFIQEYFNKFKIETDFKKNIINYLIEQIPNKKDLLSIYDQINEKKKEMEKIESHKIVKFQMKNVKKQINVIKAIQKQMTKVV